MKSNHAVKIVFPVLSAIFGVPIVLNYQAIAERWGWSTAIADIVAPENGPSPVAELVSTPWFLATFLVALGVAGGIWIDVATRAFDRRRSNKLWWLGLHTFSVRSFSCLVAGIQDADFENSSRAKAVANEILSYVNSGHIPLAMEMKEIREQSLRLQDRHLDDLKPPYSIKSVGPEAIVFKRDLEGLARVRQWNLPWPIPPKATVGNPLATAAPMPRNALLSLAGLIQQKIADQEADDPAGRGQ